MAMENSEFHSANTKFKDLSRGSTSLYEGKFGTLGGASVPRNSHILTYIYIEQELAHNTWFTRVFHDKTKFYILG